MWLTRAIILNICLIFAVKNVHAKILQRQIFPPNVIKTNPRAVQPDWGYIEMPLDHYNPTDQRTWTMRYMNSSQHFKPGRPILIFLGGEWEIEASFLQGGFAFDIAEQNNAYMFYTEHRYYGKSYPTENTSTENLRYLSVDQALEDLAFFIQSIKMTEFVDSKVMVVGASYSATLATWLRMKYPHLVDVAYASSAPLRMVKDFYESFEVVGQLFREESADCYETLRQGVQQAQRMFAAEEGRKELSEAFNTCDTLRNEEQYKSYFFLFGISDSFSQSVLYAEIGGIKTTCDAFLGYDGTPLQKLASFIRSANEECIKSYDDFIDYYSNTTNGLIEGLNYRLWYHQACTELGLFVTATSDKQPFTNAWGVDFYLHICRDLFGDEFTESVVDNRVKRTNIVYGSTGLSVNKLLSIHGSADPWHTLGLTESDSPEVVAIYVNGSTHCADLMPVSDVDSDAMKEAKEIIKETIERWLQE